MQLWGHAGPTKVLLRYALFSGSKAGYSCQLLKVGYISGQGQLLFAHIALGGAAATTTTAAAAATRSWARLTTCLLTNGGLERLVLFLRAPNLAAAAAAAEAAATVGLL